MVNRGRRARHCLVQPASRLTYRLLSPVSPGPVENSWSGRKKKSPRPGVMRAPESLEPGCP